MTFRPATLMDAGWLYNLRCEDEAGAWYDSNRTDYGQHIDWLGARLRNPLVQLLVWNDGEGMARIDSNGELSFHGPVEMIRDLIASYGGRLKATIDYGDPKADILAAAGFEVYPATFLAYKP